LNLSPGVLTYALGLVIIASQSSRFWLGMALALFPILVTAVGAALRSGRSGGIRRG
jgi:hypothetical protein